MTTFPSPFDTDRLCGSVVRVNGSGAVINLPRAASKQPLLHLGHIVHLGAVGEFVVIECGHVAVLGRIDAVRLPEKDRLTVEDRYSDRETAHPLGEVSLVASVDLVKMEVKVGVTRHPRLGASVYSAHPELVRWVARRGQNLDKKLAFATLLDDPEATIEVPTDSLFARHCAVVGSTGSGKSFTLSRLMEECIPLGCKVLLIDSTGEFETFADERMTHCALNKTAGPERLVRIPYSRLRVEDMFALFRPGPQIQAIKVREAVRSLRVALLENVATIEKENRSREEISELFAQHIDVLESTDCAFNVFHLAAQIDLECIWPSQKGYGADPSKYGNADESARGHCVSLMSRIESIVSDSTLKCLFGKEDSGQDFIDVIDWFLATGSCSILRLSLKHLPESHNAPAVLVNAIARFLLRYSRDGKFKERPLILAVDEAHRYMNKAVTDEESHQLDGLELISKEGRKEGLYLTLSTQRPRDLGHAVLSQAGSLIAHRLTHPDDRYAVERAAGEFAANAAAILSGLAPGQAVMLGVDFPVPMTVQIKLPTYQPNSESPSLVAEHDQPLPDTPWPFVAPPPPVPKAAPAAGVPVNPKPPEEYDPFADD